MTAPKTSRPARARRCVVVRGDVEQTRAAARRLVEDLDASAVVWIESQPRGDVGHVGVAPRELAGLLGQSFDAVVLDAHAGLDADVLGQSHGLVWGGGALILRVPKHGPPPVAAALAAHPYHAKDVGARFWTHVERALCGAEHIAASGSDVVDVLARPRHDVVGSDEQAQVVARLSEAWSGPGPTRIALLADRGRGKSSALGLALATCTSNLAAIARADERLRVAISAPSPASVTELFRFAPTDARSSFVAVVELAFGDAPIEPFDLIIIDEAAQLPVPILRALVQRHARAHLCFATTTHGYEGTGRGFSLRFLAKLERETPALERLTLTQPIRWDDGDPLERMVFDALLLDAEPTQIQPRDAMGASELGIETTAERIDRDVLLDDPETLRELFGLLVHAHYRTTPGDLHRLLDAPNLAIHVLRLRGHVVAATLVAEEGGLSAQQCDELLSGRRRIRAHALAELLVAHLGKRDAGRLSMIRSVRVATHPSLRRLGLARRLVEHVHRSHAPELFGTVFGATAELLAFRRQLGYEVVRISASRGARTGEPSVMMLRPVSAPAHALLTELRAELARDLPRQLELLDADGETLLDPALVESLLHDLPAPAPCSAARCRALVESYAHGPRTFESVALAARLFVECAPQRVAGLDAAARALIDGRVVAGRSWRRVSEDAGFATVPAAMRALRRALRELASSDH